MATAHTHPWINRLTRALREGGGSVVVLLLLIGLISSTGAVAAPVTGADDPVSRSGTASRAPAAAVAGQAAGPSSYSAAVLGRRPIGYWRLDEASGTRLTDTSGHNHTGAYTGQVSHGLTGSLAGDSDTAIGFDGTGDAATVRLDLSTTSRISVEFWLNWAAYADDDRLALEFGNTYQDVKGFLVDPNSSTMPGQFEVSLGDGRGASYNNVFFERPSAGAWHHYVFVLDRAAGANAITPYVDGVAVKYTKGAATSQSGNFASSTLSLMSRNGSSLFGSGGLDELAIYPTALSATDVSTDYSVGHPPYSATILANAPAAYWRLDEDSGAPSLTDASGHNNTGVYRGLVGHGLIGSLAGESDTATGFDGTSGAATVPLDLSTTSAISVEFWLKWAVYADDDRLALEFGKTYQEVNGFLIDPNSRTMRGQFEVSLGDGRGGAYNNVSFARPSAGDWHHYVFVLDRAGGANAITPYVDGVAVKYAKRASGTQSGNFASTTLSLMSRNGTSLFGAGVLDEVAIYPNALSAAQVAADYAAGGGAVAPATPDAAGAAIGSVPAKGSSAVTSVPAKASSTAAASAPPDVAVAPAQIASAAGLSKPSLAGVQLAKSGAPSPTGAVKNFAPSVLPKSGPELGNSMRGEYQWYGDPVDPNGWPFQDSYTRWDWKQFEPSQGNYNYALIDNELAKAAGRHGRFGFRLMAACTGCYGGGASVPDYIVSSGAGHNVQDSGHSFFIPDWNNSFYLSRVEALMAALGKRYANDPRLGWIDMMGYGNWGEWHDWPYSSTPTLSDANAERIVNANLNNFPNKPIVALTSHTHALSYALGKSPRVGLRADCLGAAGMSGAIDYMKAVPASQDRWKTAPFITEWCAHGPGSGLFPTGDQQVSQYHVSMLSSGNYSQSGGGISSYSSAEQAAFTDANKVAGYRFVLNNLTLPSQLTAGGSFSVATTWENVNVAPAYQPLAILVQLRTSGGQVAWQGQSGLDLRTLLPTNGTPLKQVDGFTLGKLASGTYTVSVQVVDPDGINVPLNLAINGRQPDGSYTLGSVSVR